MITSSLKTIVIVAGGASCATRLRRMAESAVIIVFERGPFARRFVPAVLIFAGITDWCGMGMLIAKMPWNQCGDGSSCVK